MYEVYKIIPGFTYLNYVDKCLPKELVDTIKKVCFDNNCGAYVRFVKETDGKYIIKIEIYNGSECFLISFTYNKYLKYTNVYKTLFSPEKNKCCGDLIGIEKIYSLSKDDLVEKYEYENTLTVEYTDGSIGSKVDLTKFEEIYKPKYCTYLVKTYIGNTGYQVISFYFTNGSMDLFLNDEFEYVFSTHGKDILQDVNGLKKYLRKQVLKHF